MIDSLFFTIVGLFGLFSWVTDKRKYGQLSLLLLFVSIILFARNGFSEESQANLLLIHLILYLVFNFTSSLYLKGEWKKFLGLISSTTFLLWQGSQFQFLGYPVVFNASNVLLLPILGAAFPLIIEMKGKWLARFFHLDQQVLTDRLDLLGAALLLVFAHFFGESLGLILVGVAFYGSSVYQQSSRQGSSFLLLLAALLPVLSNQLVVESLELGSRSVLLGLLLGAGMAFWFSLDSRDKQNSPLQKILYFLFPLLLYGFFVFIELFKEHLGGIPAGIAAIFAIGIAFAASSHENISIRSALVGMTIAVLLIAGVTLPGKKAIQKPGLSRFEQLESGHDLQAIDFQTNDSIPSSPEKVDEGQMQKKMENEGSESTKESQKEVENKQESAPTNELPTGQWEIVSKASELTFELGPQGSKTTGAFQQINGLFSITPEAANSSVSVKLPLKGFTTYNDFRDESLMEEEYLHASSFPEVSFQSDSWLQKGKQMQVKGKVKLRGISQNITLLMKVVSIDQDEKGPFMLLVGSSQLDRSKHGMESDPKIGDLVSFQFKLELRKKGL